MFALKRMATLVAKMLLLASLLVGCGSGQWCLGDGSGNKCTSTEPGSNSGTGNGEDTSGALNRGGVYTPGGAWSPALDNARAACERATLHRCEYLEWDKAVGNSGARKVSGEVSSMCKTAVLDAVAVCLANQQWYQQRFGKAGYTVTHVKVRCRSYQTGRDLTQFRVYCPAAMLDYSEKAEPKFCDPLASSGSDQCPAIAETTKP